MGRRQQKKKGFKKRYILIGLLLLGMILPGGNSNDNHAAGKPVTTTIEAPAKAEPSETEPVTDLSEVSSAPEETMMSAAEEEQVSEDISTEAAPETDPEDLGELTVHFIDVGQGDCTLITCNDEAMLIDAGDNSKGTTVQSYLKKQNISKLKYVLATHPDADHIGGMDVILYKFDCETILMSDQQKDTETYRDVIDTLDVKGYKTTLPVVGDEYSLGSATFTIIGPVWEYEDDNKMSTVIRLVHGNNKFLFSGDAEYEALNDLTLVWDDLSAQVLKMSHHGSSNGCDQGFLNAVSPTYALISCGKDNDYGHPHEETMSTLQSMGVQMYRTDEQGSVTVTSDGSSLAWSCESSDNWKSGSQIQSSKEKEEAVEVTKEVTREAAPETTYILNTNTKKFHYPTCSSVNEMKEKNKKETTEDRDTIISKGYKSCGRCHP